jgi:hypothetical protein
MRISRKYLWLAAVIFAAVCLIAFSRQYIALIGHTHECNALRESVRSLEKRRPLDVSPHVWASAVWWIDTACANVFTHPRYTPTDEVRRFRIDFENRIQGPVDLKTIDWAWERIAETGDMGKEYRDRYETHYRQALEPLRDDRDPR